ncbi:MAG TPA: right-handed parallel beta-helix repeat-containing protein [Nannocystaceae bacterium]|nr:right-handed parallel beta-helix repeat-containing protein [Nannocystaceae bacterium]
MTTPWATITHADGVLVAGDVLHVLPGEYEGSFDTYAAGTEAAPIVFMSETKWGAVLVASDGPWTVRGDYVDVVGFEYTGDAHVGMLSMASHTRYLGNWVHHLNPACDGNGGAAIDAGNYEASDVDMIGNLVHDVWADDENGMPCNRVQGLYHSIRGGTVANNIVWHISGFGIHTWHAPQDLIITNNLVFDSGRGGIIVGAGDSPGGVIADNFLVANNIVVYNALGILEYGETGANNRYVNNLVYENAGGDFSLQNGLVDEGTVVAEPLFVDWQLDGSGDYHLVPDSPAIDAGVVEGAPMNDYDDIARPQGAGIDIGPYEYFEEVGESSSSGGDGTGAADDTAGDGASESEGGSMSDDTSPPITEGGTMPGSETGAADDTGDTSQSDDEGDGCACAAEPRRDRTWLLVAFLVLLRRVTRTRAPGTRPTRPR